MIPRSNQNRSIDKEFVLNMAQERLTFLHQKYDHYFSPLIRNDMNGSEILFRLMFNCHSAQELSLPVRENVLEIRSDRTLRSKFSVVLWDEFCISIE